MIEQVPHRFRYDSFLRYVNIIGKVQENFPRATTFTPSNFSAETVACRLRDAVKAFRLNKDWTHERVSRQWIEEFWDEMMVAHNGKTVTVLKKGEKVPELIETSGITHTTTRITLNEPTVPTLAACVVLLDAGVLTEPVLVENLLPDLEERIQTHLTTKYPHIHLQPRPDKPNTFLLL